MNWIEIFRSGISTGTVLLIASIGEILTERAGIQNLGVEGMMLVGAMAGFRVALTTGNVWLGLLAAIAAGGLLSLAHAVVTIHFQADQTVSGLSLTFWAQVWHWSWAMGSPVRLRLSSPTPASLCSRGSHTLVRLPLLITTCWSISATCSCRLSRISSTKPVRVSICALWGRTLLLLTRWASISTAPAISTPSSADVLRVWLGLPSALPLPRVGTQT